MSEQKTWFGLKAFLSVLVLLLSSLSLANPLAPSISAIVSREFSAPLVPASASHLSASKLSIQGAVERWAGSANQANFFLSPPAYFYMYEGTTVSIAMPVSAVADLVEPITLSAEGLPPGVTVTFSPATVSSDDLVWMNVTAAPGTSTSDWVPFAVVGTSADTVVSVDVLVFIWSADFNLNSANGSSVSAQAGVPANLPFNVTSSVALQAPIVFSVSGLPNGSNPTFSPPQLGGDGATSLNFTLPRDTPEGLMPVVVTGTSGGIQKTSVVYVTVLAAPNFSLGQPFDLYTVVGRDESTDLWVQKSDGFTDPITYSMQGLPSGVTCTFGSDSSDHAYRLPIHFTVTDLAPSGTFPVTVVAQSGELSHSATFNLILLPKVTWSFIGSPYFWGQGGPEYFRYSWGGQVGYETDLPDYAFQLWTPDPSPYGTMIDVGYNTYIGHKVVLDLHGTGVPLAPGTYTFSGTAIAIPYAFYGIVDYQVESANKLEVQVEVTNPDFSFTPLETNYVVRKGSYANFPLGIYPMSALFTQTGGSLVVTDGGTLSNIATFTPGPIDTYGGGSSFTLTPTASVIPGTYPFTLTGNGAWALFDTNLSGSVSHSQSSTLTILPPAQFALAASPSTQMVAPGAGASYQVSLTQIDSDFYYSVPLSVTGLPSGASASFSGDAAYWQTVSMNVTTSSSTPVGTYPLTIKGVSPNGVTKTTSATLVVKSSTPAPSFNLTLKPSSVTMKKSGESEAEAVLTVTPTNGFKSKVAVGVSGAPKGLKVSTESEGSCGGSKGTTFEIEIEGKKVAAGTYPLTISVSGGGVTKTTVLTVVIK